MAATLPFFHSMRQYAVPNVSHLSRCQFSRSTALMASFGTPDSSCATGWSTFSRPSPALTTDTGSEDSDRAFVCSHAA